ncbi:MAG: hypothetical protein QOF61_2997 [Acidobacteriota bacterium]|jgi:hypothetical protein|nr:hypothetical protein [Acidobacteriota bacterium]
MPSDSAPTAETKLLAVSFAFPPLAYPRSIQVARLLKYVPLQTVLVCADERAARRDATLEPDAEATLAAVLRVPFAVSRARSYANAAAHRLSRPLWNRWNRRPDSYAAWKTPALKAIDDYARANAYAPEAIATFSQPAVDHLIGLELKRRLRVPWLAHFSDPWVDNPFHATDAATRAFNLAAERAVVEVADRLVFTSVETVDLVMSKYPEAWRAKARVLPQCFDPQLYPARANVSTTNDAGSSGVKGAGDARLVVRHVGNFYGERTPAPLMRALAALRERDADALRDARFELIGVADASVIEGEWRKSLPQGLVTAAPPVGYRESLRLMSEAAGLIIIDAPADVSVFLPSKLIDYVGAGRPVLGFSPRGAAASLIERLGGWTIDPADASAGASALKNFLAYLRSRADDATPWGTPEVRREYEATHLAAKFDEIVRELLS